MQEHNHKNLARETFHAIWGGMKSNHGMSVPDYLPVLNITQPAATLIAKGKKGDIYLLHPLETKLLNKWVLVMAVEQKDRAQYDKDNVRFRKQYGGGDLPPHGVYNSIVAVVLFDRCKEKTLLAKDGRQIPVTKWYIKRSVDLEEVSSRGLKTQPTQFWNVKGSENDSRISRFVMREAPAWLWQAILKQTPPEQAASPESPELFDKNHARPDSPVVFPVPKFLSVLNIYQPGATVLAKGLKKFLHVESQLKQDIIGKWVLIMSLDDRDQYDKQKERLERYCPGGKIPPHEVYGSVVAVVKFDKSINHDAGYPFPWSEWHISDVIEMETKESQFLATPPTHFWNVNESAHNNLIFRTVKKYVPENVWDEMLHYSAPTDGLDDSSVFMGTVTAKERKAHAKAKDPGLDAMAVDLRLAIAPNFFSDAGEASAADEAFYDKPEKKTLKQLEEEAKQDERVAKLRQVLRNDLSLADLRDRLDSEAREQFRQQDIRLEASWRRQAASHREMNAVIAADEMLHAGGMKSAKKAVAEFHPDRIQGFYQKPAAEQERLNRKFVKMNELRTVAEELRKDPRALFDKIDGKTDEAARARDRAEEEKETKRARERERADEDEFAEEKRARTRARAEEDAEDTSGKRK